MTVLLNMNDQLIEQFYKTVTDYLWGVDKPHTIPTKVLTKSKECGGLRLVDMCAKQNALKVQWILRCKDSIFVNNIFCNEFETGLGHFIW